MLKLFQILQLFIGIFMWTLIAQGMLVLLLGEKRQRNPAYRIAAFVTWPIIRFTRLLMPRFVVDTHIGFAAFFLLLALRIALYMFFYSQGWIEIGRPPPEVP